MRASRLRLAIASFVLALVFLLLDVVNVGFVLGRTGVAIYPVAFFALAGLVLLASAVRGRPSRRDDEVRRGS